MGRSRTPKYVVELVTPGFYTSPSEWRVKDGCQTKGSGKPTDENLKKFVEQFVASMQPGGVNAHLQEQGKPYVVTHAFIYHNTSDRHAGPPLAEWRMPSVPLFTVELEGRREL